MSLNRVYKYTHFGYYYMRFRWGVVIRGRDGVVRWIYWWFHLLRRVLQLRHTDNNIPISYREIFTRNNWTLREIKKNSLEGSSRDYLDVYELFKTDPTTLATRYANDSSSLTNFEKDRIIHEGSLTTLRTMYQLLANPADPLIQALIKRWNCSLEVDGMIL